MNRSRKRPVTIPLSAIIKRRMELISINSVRLRTTLTAFLLIGLVLGSALLLRPHWRYPIIKQTPADAPLRTIVPLLSQTEVEYAFMAPEGNLAGIDICFVTYKRKNDSTVNLVLKNRKTGALIARKTILASEVKDWEYHPWRFKPKPYIPGKEYLLVIQDNGAGPRSCLGLVVHDQPSEGSLYLRVNGQAKTSEPFLAIIGAEPIPVWNSPLVWFAVWIGFCLLWLLPKGSASDPPAEKAKQGITWVEYFGCLVIMGGCLLFRAWRATKGIDFSDEGMHLATTMRYSLGDLPFRNEIMNTFRMSDVMISPLFVLFPEITLLQIRLFGLSIQAFSLAAAFLFFKRMVRPLVLAAVLGLILVTHDTYGLSVPSYNLVSAFFILLGPLAWLEGLNADSNLKRIYLSALAGLLTAGAAISYFSLVGLAILPAGVCLLGIFEREKRKTLFVSGGSFLFAFFCVITAVAITVVAKGLGPDFLEVVQSVGSTTELIKSGPWAKLGQVSLSLAEFCPQALSWLGVIVGSLLLGGIKQSRAGRFLGLFLLLGTAGFEFLGTNPELPRHGIDQSNLWYLVKLPLMSFSVLLGLIILGLSWVSPLKNHLSQETRLSYSLGILWGLAATAIYSLSTSAIQPHAGFNGVPVLLLFSLLGSWALWGRKIKKQLDYRYISLVFVAAALILTFTAVRESYDVTYRDGPATTLKTQSTHPKLAGLVSSERRMGSLDNLLYYLEGRVKPGDLFFAMKNLPLLYYLTGTRPVPISAWIPNGWSQGLYTRIYDKIIEQGRIPEYCVRISDRNSLKTGVEAEFLSKYFILINKIDIYEVWQKVGN